MHRITHYIDLAAQASQRTPEFPMLPRIIYYKKSYYSDRDIKPNENLIFTITLFPLTTYEHNAEDLVN